MSIQELLSFCGPTLTEAANGTRPNCTGLSICLISFACEAKRIDQLLGGILEQVDAPLPEPVP